jgi:hypothetical protein
LFEIIGHADLPKKFGHRPTKDCTPLYERFLTAAKKHNCAIELNTAGLRKDCKEIYPGRQILALAFAKGVPITFGSDAHKPRGKYQILTTIAQKYTVHPGYPGTSNAAFDEMFNKFIIPKMFAQVSKGQMSAQEAVNAADREIRAIYAKWRRLGKI